MRDNILFGKEYNAARFASVIHACSMTHDLKILPHADMTVIGDRGVNLSGKLRPIGHNYDLFLLMCVCVLY